MLNAAGAPGFFGKAPAFGDFLSRRGPPGLRAEWEGWLAGLAVAARTALGADWPENWLTAPLLHFLLGSGIAPPDGAAGVLVASADRVGRMFPFTIIGAAAGGSESDAAARNDWARQVEAMILSALDDDFGPNALDNALQVLGPPPAMQGTTRAAGHWRLTFDGDWPIDGTADEGWQPPGSGQSAWWCRGSDRVAPMHLRCAGLPGPATSAAMITGDFDFTNC